MKFTELTITNFLSIETAKLQLADRGLVLIQGINEDNTSALSNGSGKSSIADALCWCLYGATARGVSGDAVINRNVGKNTRVSVTLVDGANSWAVERHRKDAIHKNALILFRNNPDGTQTALTMGTDKLTQEMVDQIVGSSYEVFRAAVYAGQEAMPDLPAMTDKQLKLLVEEAAGVTILEAAYKEALIKLRQAEEAVERAEGEVSDREKELDADHTNLVAYRKGHREFEEKRKSELDAFEGQLLVARDAIEALRVLIGKVDEAAITAEIAALELKIAAVADERSKEKALEKTLRDEDIGLLNASTKVKAWKSEYDAAKAKYEEVGSIVGKPCDDCGKLYCEDDIADTRARLKARLKEVADKAPDMKKLVEDAKGRAGKARETLDAYRATMTDVSATSAQIASLREEIGELRSMEKDLATFAKDEAATLGSIRRRTAEVNPFADLVDLTESRISDGKKDLEAAKKAVSYLEGELRIAESVAKVFSPAGVRAHILDEVTPFLNDQTAKYLASLTDGNTTATWSTLVKTAKGELREKFSIEVADSTGGESFAALSGGEKRKVRIAAALALQDLVARRATKPIELFIGDEIDDALDEAGLERLLGILEEKARERGSVFIISHNSLTDWVPAAITVTKKDGKSVVIDEVV